MDVDIRIELYANGYSLRQVGEMTNYSKSAVYSFLLANGVEMRPPGLGQRIEMEKLQANYTNGHSQESNHSW